jgi:phosphoglycerol transferase MdoB-like AlkP superfamily enzyme
MNVKSISFESKALYLSVSYVASINLIQSEGRPNCAKYRFQRKIISFPDPVSQTDLILLMLLGLKVDTQYQIIHLPAVPTHDIGSFFVFSSSIVQKIDTCRFSPLVSGLLLVLFKSFLYHRYAIFNQFLLKNHLDSQYFKVSRTSNKNPESRYILNICEG